VVLLVKSKGNDITVKRIIIFVFIASMILTIGLVGYLVFFNWHSSARDTTERISSSINKSIYNELRSFMEKPYHVNEVNHFHLENGSYDLSDATARERFFVGVLEAHDNHIYSFSFGSEKGDYYGARINETGEIEIMRNNQETGGESWYYSVKDDHTAGERVVEAGSFDPRTRDWYRVASDSGGPTFSPVYKHFVMDDLSISAAWPIYNDQGDLQGVMGTHMLLGEIGSYLSETVDQFQGDAIIFEKGTGGLIANSMGADNFNVLEDGNFDRMEIVDLGDREVSDAYGEYLGAGAASFVYGTGSEDYFVNIRELNYQGLEWVVLTAIPEGFLMERVNESLGLTLLLVLAALILSGIAYNLITNRMFRPVEQLLEAAEKLSAGDLTQRVRIARKDEIGRISESFNMVAGRMQYLINDLEDAVSERTVELDLANTTLEENKNQLQLILDSTAEAIFGIDLEGRCTFCNKRSLELLGYRSQEDLIGQKLHVKIHHSHKGGMPYGADQCKILRTVREGEGVTSEEEVFWKKNGTSFPVEYHSFPQVKNGRIIGAVVTFMDITERKERENKIKYLTYHDNLTGLLNRLGFEDVIDWLDVEDKLPLSVIFADINGLKLTNDIFGHAVGDKLIRKASEILVGSTRSQDTVSRIGGDEFVILLPRTDRKSAGEVVTRIRKGFSNTRVEAIKCSISLGYDTKTSNEESIEEIMGNAENMMYKDKTINRRAVNKGMISNIQETLYSRNPREKRHSMNVSRLAAQIGAELGLRESEISRLKRAGYLHDIGKITIDREILSRDDSLDEEAEVVKQHSVVGYRLLNMFDETVDLAEYIYSHHEHWDGSGYPRGLKGGQIPLLSRILAVAEVYERILNSGDGPVQERRKRAVDVIREGSGSKFDPQVVEALGQIDDGDAS
jgi:diguanylate cyclase (GGDEF)-like protein/PAS domain S-box-containing protein/putative nucleotidyltransferase with HDIG domain